MIKETIFLSHSSKDKDAIKYLKDLIQEKTGSTLNIFLSSDGQSIPFGTNWVHKIEQGLNESIIMFVFITPNSIKSDWIYFESGFAYAKDVKVIPIGIGTSISELKPPLNLLQGFNISSKDSINNIIKVINDECNTTFREDTSNEEYETLLRLTGFHANDFSITSVVDLYETRIFPYTVFETKQKVEIDVYKILEFLREDFKEQGFQFANLEKQVVFSGFRAKITSHRFDKSDNEIIIDIGNDVLDLHFDTVKKIVSEAYGDKDNHFLKVNFASDYNIISNELKMSALVNKTESIGFSESASSIGYTFSDLNFFIKSSPNKCVISPVISEFSI